MSEPKKPPNIAESFFLLRQYDELHELTAEESEKLSDLTYLFFADLMAGKNADLAAIVVRSIFNLGYESGQKSKER